MAPTSEATREATPTMQTQRRQIKQRPRTIKPWTPTVLKFGTPTSLPPPTPPLPPRATLPNLQLLTSPARAITIEVENTPERRGSSWTWIVRTRPTRQIESGQLIILAAGHLQSGVGRIREIAEFRRHWITWSIDGGLVPCDVRVPTSWSRLGDRDRRLHTRLYHLLSPSPLPHQLLLNDLALLEGNETPYEFDSDSDDSADDEPSYNHQRATARRDANES